jgi:hypothetical protein
MMSDLLTSVAEVSVSIAGFSGLFVASSSRSGSLTRIDRYALIFLLFCSLGATLLALLPFVLMSMTDRPDFAPWFCAISGAVILSISIWSSGSRLRALQSTSQRLYRGCGRSSCRSSGAWACYRSCR